MTDFSLEGHFPQSKYLWLLMAALQKGHFGKGHLQERNQAREGRGGGRNRTGGGRQRTVRELLKTTNVENGNLKIKQLTESPKKRRDEYCG